MRLLLLVALFFVGACDNFHDVQKADTIEAYQAYMAENPTSQYRFQAEVRLEELMLAKADKDKTLESYDAYLEAYPKGHYLEKALKKREQFLFDWAMATYTVPAFEKFMSEYPKAKKKRKQKIRRAIKMAQYQHHIGVGEVSMKQVNLAEDPEGPLNGWGFYVDVTNNGEQTVTYLALTIAYLDKQGKGLSHDEWPVVAPQYSVPMPEETKVPIKAGETRTWEWTTGELPEGWAKTTRIYASGVYFEGEK